MQEDDLFDDKLMSFFKENMEGDAEDIAAIWENPNKNRNPRSNKKMRDLERKKARANKKREREFYGN